MKDKIRMVMFLIGIQTSVRLVVQLFRQLVISISGDAEGRDIFLVCVCVCVCVRACVRACMRVCVCVCVR